MNKEKTLKILKNTAAVVVLLSLFVIIFYQNRDRDILKFGGGESNKIISSSQDGSKGYIGGDVKRMGDEMIYITTSSLNTVNKNGEMVAREIAMSEPFLHVEGNYYVCYNKNSTEADVYKKSNLIYSVITDNKIISAKVNKNGYLFVATEKEGYNCECIVFNKNGEAIFKWDISKGEFLDGDVNYSNNKIAISVAASGSDKLLGEVTLIDTTDASIENKKTYDSEIFYQIDFNANDTFVGLGNKSLTYFNSDGTQKWSYSYGGKTLIKADVSNPDLMAIVLEGPGAVIGGKSYEVKIINRIGAVSSEKACDDIIDSISVSESGVAVAMGRKVVIYDASLKEKKTIETEYSIKKAVLFNDNKHVFILGGTGGEILD